MWAAVWLWSPRSPERVPAGLLHPGHWPAAVGEGEKTVRLPGAQAAVLQCLALCRKKMRQKSNTRLRMRSQGQGHWCPVRTELWEGEGEQVASRAQGKQALGEVHTAWEKPPLPGPRRSPSHVLIGKRRLAQELCQPVVRRAMDAIGCVCS